MLACFAKGYRSGVAVLYQRSGTLLAAESNRTCFECRGFSEGTKARSTRAHRRHGTNKPQRDESWLQGGSSQVELFPLSLAIACFGNYPTPLKSSHPKTKFTGNNARCILGCFADTQLCNYSYPIYEVDVITITVLQRVSEAYSTSRPKHAQQPVACKASRQVMTPCSTCMCCQASLFLLYSCAFMTLHDIVLDSKPCLLRLLHLAE